MKRTFVIRGTVARYPGPGGWHFVSSSKKVAEDLRKASPMEVEKVGWGYIKVTAKVGGTSWATTLFPDRKSGTYFIAIKESVHKKEGIKNGDKVSIKCELV